MSEIIIKPYNETYVKINCEPDIAQELYDYFTISIPNPQYLIKGWNGKIRLFNKRETQIYKGLVSYINDWSNKHNYTVTFSDQSLIQNNDIDMNLLKNVIRDLELPVEPYEHQLLGVYHALKRERTTLIVPTAGGKSLIIYILTRIINGKTLIIVPTTNLVEQLYNDFISYCCDNWNVHHHVHKIYSGHEKHTDKQIIISTWQSLQNLPKEYFENFKIVIGDEAHGCSANKLKYIIGSCTNARYRFGLTGTIQDTKCHILTIEGLFGPIYKPTTTTKLISEKKLSEFEIKCILLKHQKQHEMTYHEELNYLIGNLKRNTYIINLALTLKNNTLILYQFVSKHGLILYDMFKKINTNNEKNIYFISGQIETEVREQIRRIAEKETNAVIIASYGTFSFGVNIKNLHNIIFASPSKGRIRIMQSIGRQLRLHPTKNCAYLFDIADELNDNKLKNYTFNHFLQRLNLYHEEEFKFNIFEIEL